MPKISTASTDRHILSKTSFIKFLQCEKSLYLYKNRYFLRDKLSAEQVAIFKRGHNIGKLAWELFPNGIDASPSSPLQYEKAILKTSELIKNREKIVYEASFRFNKSLCILDVLVLNENGLYAYEVKSSRDISQVYIHDAAYQYYVMKGAGCEPKDFFIIHVNKDYTLKEKFDISEYFKIVSVFDQIIKLQPFIEQSIERAKDVVALPKSPQIDIGLHCDLPYTCDFKGFCRKHLPENNIFSISDLSLENQYQQYKQNILSVMDINIDDINDISAQKQIISHKENINIIDEKQIIEISGKYNNNIVYANFVYSAPATPDIIGFQPYQPYLIGCFIKSEVDNELIKSYVYDIKSDYYDFLSIIKNEFKEKNIVVFENNILNNELLHIETLSIQEILKQKVYYNPKFKGDYCIENIYKCMFNNALKCNIVNNVSFRDFVTDFSKRKIEQINDIEQFAKNQIEMTKTIFEKLIKLND